MSNLGRWLLAAWIGLCLSASLLLLNPVAGAELPPAESQALPLLSELLTIPLPLREMADLRRVVLPIALGGLMVFSMVVRPAAALPRWYTPLTITLIGFACFSALINRTVEYSAGWIVQLVCGVAWAGMLARLTSAGLVRTLFGVIAVVSLLAAAATFWHRHKFGYLYVRWPIGPITLCAELGALWLVGAAGFLVGRLRQRQASPAGERPWMAALTALMVGLAGLSLVVVSGRRGAYVGVLMGGSLVAGLALAARMSARAARRLAIGGSAVVALAVITYSAIQYRGPSREGRGSLTVRAYYWGCMLTGIAENPVLGVGPDQFVCDGASRLARDRAEMPHVLHGSVEPAGHNEWLQAIYELGIPGGLLYVAIPFAVLAGGIRRWRAGSAPESSGCLLALMASLATLVVTEAVSINLRYQIMPLWYWTLVGLTLGLSRRTDSVTPSASAAPWPVWPARVFGLAAAGAVAVVDVTGSYHVARGHAILGRDPAAAREHFDRVFGPFGAARRLEMQFDAATAWENIIASRLPAGFSGGTTALPETLRPDYARFVLTPWERLYAVNRAYPGVATRLTVALVLDRQLERAKALLADYLLRVDPYDPAANLMQARGFAASAEERLDCAVRALRGGAVTGDIVSLAREQLGDAAVSGLWSRRLARAEQSLPVDENQWTENLAPEVARLNAALLDTAGDRAGAATWQVRAAECYKRLYDANHPHRRASAAEVDAWRQAAELTFKADPARFEAAAQDADEAERFAVLGMAHEYLRDADPSAGFVGGVVVPVEVPDWSRAVWQTSAKMHLAAGRMTMLDRRLRSALPPNRQSEGDLGAALRFLSRELVAGFETIPAEKRPPHFSQLKTWAGLGAASAPASVPSSTTTPHSEP